MGATKETTIVKILYMHDTFKTGSPLFEFVVCFAATAMYENVALHVGDL